MPRTFCNDALTSKGRHKVKVKGCTYIMSGSWIDTTCPNDMMDYDLTASFGELKNQHEEIRLNNLR